MRLLLASTNAHKLEELGALLRELPIELLSPAACGGLPEVEEDAPDFAGNARLKAVSAARAARVWTLADDSGLEVEALGGTPGVRSARYAGPRASTAENNAKLLRELAGLPPERRGARFVCALALARPDASIAAELSGTARGRILEAPRGAGGFGYDPLFLFEEPGQPGSGLCFAELSGEQKSLVSHRGRAMLQLRQLLAGWTRSEPSAQH